MTLKSARETIALVIDEVERMERMVSDLLVLPGGTAALLNLEDDIEDLTSDVHSKASALAPRRWCLSQKTPASDSGRPPAIDSSSSATCAQCRASHHRVGWH